MTTDPQAPPNDAIPPWFMEFANENTRQHAELASQIADARLETANLRTEMIEKLGTLEARTTERLSTLEARTTERLGTLEARTTEQIGALRTEIAETRTEMHREFASLLRWAVGTMVGMGVAVVGSLIYAVERLA